MPEPPPAEDLPFLAETIIREARFARWERRIERAIRRGLTGMMDEVLRDTRRAVVAAGEMIPGPWEQLLVAELRAANEANADEIIAAMRLPGGFDELALFGGYDFSAQEQRLIARVIDMAAGTAQSVAEELHMGTAAGESFDKLAARVQDVFASSDVRARRIARTEVISAANGAQFGYAGAVYNSGQQMTKTWLATFDRRTRETHADAHGQTVAYDQPFVVGGAELEFPGDPNGPAQEVVNCRCTTTFEVVGETE